MPNILDHLRKLLNPSQADIDSVEQALDERFPKRVRAQIERELERVSEQEPPRIALIGKTGVGKTSTINALFNPRPPLPVGHVRATTRKPREQRVTLGDGRGNIVIVDTPGFNESIKADARNLPIIRDLLSKSDVALWVLKADERALAEDQRLIKELLTSSPHLKERLVVGINQVDLMQPGRWNDQYNLPSSEQEHSIERKVNDVRRLLRSVGVNPQHIQPYSALRAYHLPHLFRAMLEACPLDRAWLLSARQEIAPFSSPRLTDDMR